MQCDRQLGLLSQIGVGERVNFGGDNAFGGCELPSFDYRYFRFYGGENSDEFPFEVRPLGLPEVFTYTKPAEFEFRLDQFGLFFEEIINPRMQLVNLQSGTIPPQTPPQWEGSAGVTIQRTREATHRLRQKKWKIKTIST